jgi:hypothetical protein
MCAGGGGKRMSNTKQTHPRLAFDVLILAVGVAFVFLIWAAGVKAGQPLAKGPGTVLGGLYAIYLGVLFLLSYFLPDASYVLSFLRYVCEECTRGARGRHMAFFYSRSAWGLGFGFCSVVLESCEYERSDNEATSADSA